MLVNDCVNDHKERSKILYTKINERHKNNKGQTIHNENKKTETIILYSDHNKRYLEENVGTDRRHQLRLIHYTSNCEKLNKIHMDNSRRPLCRRYSF